MTYTGLYQTQDNADAILTPDISAVINWGTVSIFLAVCLLLNILSAVIPAWHASRMNPAEAIKSL